MSQGAQDTQASIDQIGERIARLDARTRQMTERLFQIILSEGGMQPPAEMAPWLERTFGSVERTLRQKIVRITNRWTFEGATFNALRSRRPGAGTTERATERLLVPPEVRERISAAEGDDFCDPEHRTPADVFGRVRGQYAVTASNVAKADGWHSVVVFDRHDPLAVDAARVADLLAVVDAWAAQAQATDPDARHLFLLWNCLWRAGASLIHGHAQMTLSHDAPHGRVALWRAAAERYRRETGGDYFADLLAVHDALGLTIGAPGVVDGFASLTPVKEREIVLLGRRGVGSDGGLAALAEPLAWLLDAMAREMGVLAFNVAAFGPPLGDGPANDDWADFPVVARFVDRGNPLAATSDIAALELFGSSVVASDPFEVARTLRGAS